jgi:L-ascorbate metabolism protein UlaG (beta-lactamase superfamily)
MKNLLLLLLFTLPVISFGQRIDADIINDITIQPIVHGTLVLTYNGKNVYVDPYGGADKFDGLATADIILITDIHGDHLNLETLKGLNTSKATFVVPKAVADKLPDAMKKQLVVMNNADTIKIQGIAIEAIPMYNLREEALKFHNKGRGNGYVLTLGKTRVYISGDTEDIPEMRALKNIDIAFVCMNLPFTMPVASAADAVLDFKPKIVYPYHYRGRPEVSDTSLFKKLVNEKNSKIEVRLRDWYAN